MTSKIDTVVEIGTEIFVILNKIKKSPKNTRKMPHGEASIEALAASIVIKGILQTLVVEPEHNADGEHTGHYFVTIGEGRRLAQLLRSKRKEIKRTEPIRRVIDTTNDPNEISLDENINRTDMHILPTNFARFDMPTRKADGGTEEIAVRFGVTPHVAR
jgi:ParB family transcriptional regulator, chromosome partitioning protein